MAEAAAVLGMKSVPVITDHYEKVYDPLKEKTKQGISKVKEMREQRKSGGGGYESEYSSDEYYDGPPPRRSTTGGRRRSPRDDGRRRSGRDRGDFVTEERYAYRGPARAKSAGRDGPYRDYDRDRRSKGSRRDYSDSESSVSPRPRRERRKSLGEKALVALGLGGAATALNGGRERSRSRPRNTTRRDRSISSDYSARPRRDDRSRGTSRGVQRSRGIDDDRTPARYKPIGYGGGESDYQGGGQVARRNNQGDVAPRNGGNGRAKSRKGSSSSDSESSSVCSSSEDERRTKKMKGKEYLTAGLAAVATIHAAHNVYASMEARDKRHAQVASGEMSPEEAKKLKNKARLQDAAAIGIAALGIKGAYSEWQEVQENRHELSERKKEVQEHHEKRLRKMEKHGSIKGGGGSNRSEPDLGRRRREDRDRDRDRDYY